MTQPAPAEEINWSVTPYIWGANVNLDVKAGGDPVLAGDVSLSDLLEDTQLAGMVHVEAMRNKGGFFFDAVYLDLGSDGTVKSTTSPLPPGTDVSADFRTGVFEAGGFFRPGGGRHGIDLLFGVRNLAVDSRIVIDYPSPSTTKAALEDTQNYTDAFVGARYSGMMGERWDFSVRGDIGSGETDKSWQGVATLGYHFGEGGRYTFRMGWRQLVIEITNAEDIESTVQSDMRLWGPLAGFTFNF